MPSSAAARPDISVIVPFRGSPEEASALVASLRRIVRTDRDQLIVVDNSPTPVVAAEEGVCVRRAALLGSSYYARNVGAAAARNDWLLFIDSDCRPDPELLDSLFAAPIEERCGLIAGEVKAAPSQRSLIARWYRSRGHLAAKAQLVKGPSPAAATANLTVRKRVWEELGGFHEVVSGADFEFCWRAGERGWLLSYRPRAWVEHLHAEDLGTVCSKARRYGSGQLWVNRRYPGASPPPELARELLRALVGVAYWIGTGRFERGLFKAIDGLSMLVFARGYWAGDNRPRPLVARRGSDSRATEIAFARRFPIHRPDGDAPCRDASRQPEDPLAGVVISLERPREVDLDALRRSRVIYLEDVPPLECLRAFTWLALLHPLRCIADVAARRAADGPPLRVLARAARLLDAAPGARARALAGGEAITARLLRLTRSPGTEGGGPA